ncbi:MAG: hypothetical protein L6R42_001892 [Xanthoria sp. 1 TBL-2021]|nr:MAG: hypothetical protein L6R42_001892 [Xanthoria sp. 1 TBL-2021]
MSKENEPSVLDYARYYGISKNHLEVDPLQQGLVPPPDEPQAPLPLDTETPWLRLSPSIAAPPPERLTAVKEASALLAVTHPKQYDHLVLDAIDLFPAHRIRHSKVELPLLRSDHEMDMRHFVHPIEPDLAEEFIPFEKVDDEQDEGLEWPSYCYAWPELYFRKAQNEKLEVGRDVFAYMNAALEARPENGELTFEYDWPIPRRNRARDPITPPLLPRSPSPKPFEPSSETGHLDFLSDHSSPTRPELDRIDKVIIQNDSLTPAEPRSYGAVTDPDKLDANSIGDLYSPLMNIHVAPSPSQHKWKRIRDLKVEGPLTPPPSHRPPPWDGHKPSLSEVLRNVSPSLSLQFPEPEQTSLDDIDMLFAEHIAPVAAKAAREIEQEQLQEADTTCRVPVPVMDFSKPKPPWDSVASDTIDEGRKAFLRGIKETYVSLPPWRLDGSTMRELSWKPFSSSQGHYQLQESIEDDGSLASFIAQPDPMDLDTLMWKPPGLGILDGIHDPEEELAYGVFPPAKDVESLIKKRNFELHDGGETLAQGNMDRSEGRRSSKDLRKPEGPRLAKSAKHDIAAEPGFSAMDALDEFLGVRTGRIKKMCEATAELPKAIGSTTAVELIRPPEAAEDRAAKTPLPTPQPRVPTAHIFLVASTSFLSNRHLACRVQSLYPSATIIERDFAIHSFQASYQGSTTKGPRTPPEVKFDEADLIVSPSTGLILTSLQKIKQQALPGQATHSPVRERIHRIAGRYERLIVVVSRAAISPDMGSEPTGNLDESDCEALVSLTAFLSHLAALSESELLFVDGDTSLLARWIVSLIVKYSAHNLTRLLEEETQWEVFLRHAGMNAFAAQAVLGELKSIAEREGGTWGLRDFILMSPEEKCQRFEGVLGGRRFIERVGKMLDARWYG